MVRHCCFLEDLLAPVGLCEMVFEILPGFKSNLHFFPLFTGFFHPSCPEEQLKALKLSLVLELVSEIM